MHSCCAILLHFSIHDLSAFKYAQRPTLQTSVQHSFMVVRSWTPFSCLAGLVCSLAFVRLSLLLVGYSGNIVYRVLFVVVAFLFLPSCCCSHISLPTACPGRQMTSAINSLFASTVHVSSFFLVYFVFKFRA